MRMSGGRTPGSTPPDSKTLADEGVVIDNERLVVNGVFQEGRMREILASGRYPARNIDQNIADLQAQIAANETGKRALLGVIHAGTGRTPSLPICSTSKTTPKPPCVRSLTGSKDRRIHLSDGQRGADQSCDQRRSQNPLRRDRFYRYPRISRRAISMPPSPSPARSYCMSSGLWWEKISP